MEDRLLLQLIGKSIKTMRENQGFTQKELAQKVKVTERTIARAECGETNLRMTIFLAISKALEVSMNELTEQ